MPGMVHSMICPSLPQEWDPVQLGDEALQEALSRQRGDGLSAPSAAPFTFWTASLGSHGNRLGSAWASKQEQTAPSHSSRLLLAWCVAGNKAGSMCITKYMPLEPDSFTRGLSERTGATRKAQVWPALLLGIRGRRGSGRLETGNGT